MKRVNMLPGADKNARGTASRGAIRISAAHTMCICAGAWVLAGVLHWIVLGWEIRAMSREVAWRKSQESSVAGLLERCGSIERMTAEIRAMRDDVPIESALALMSQLLPNGARLDSMVVRRLGGERAGGNGPRDRVADVLEVSVSGSADADAGVAEFIAALSESTFLRRVRTREQSQREGGHHFMVSMEMCRSWSASVAGRRP